MQTNASSPWPRGAGGGLSLTFDDGLDVHLERVAPLLETHGLRGTFYAHLQSGISARPQAWRELAARGHELGNHTLFHPCRKEPREKYTWVDDAFDLCTYSESRLRAELSAANTCLHFIDGHLERSFGNTCCHTTFGAGEEERSMSPMLAELFPAARGAVTHRCAIPGPELDWTNLGCFAADNRSLDDLQRYARTAMQSGGWAILMIHGIGAETHQMHLDPQAFAAFLDWLADLQGDLWVAPVIEVARQLRGTD
ncbi:MAG: hypothetical protein EA425_04175 [Puniceicoccaceae bacterium]|nr:MAG: hypothetical protein EA425_04175 [Puniceicoccaceae bacterium]